LIFPTDSQLPFGTKVLKLKFDKGWSVRTWASRQCSTVSMGVWVPSCYGAAFPEL